MKTRRAIAVGVLLLLAVRPASAVKVTTDHDETYDFEGRTKVAWIAGTPSPDELNQKRIVSGIEEALQEKGLTFVDEQQADLLIATHAAAESQVQSSGGRVGVSLGRSTRLGHVSVGGSRGNQVKQVKVGSLVIEILDAKTNSLVWTATASDTLKEGRATEKQIHSAIDKAFRKFPPASKKK
jgi:hypothetical protein